MGNPDFLEALINQIFTPQVEIEFTNNLEKGITFCDVSFNGSRLATGTAICGSNDEYDEKIGCQVALKRALADASKVCEFLNKEARAEIWQRFNYTVW